MRQEQVVFLGQHCDTHIQEHRRSVSLLCQGQLSHNIWKGRPMIAERILAKAWNHLARIQLQKPNYGSHRTKLHSVGKTHITGVSKPPLRPPLAALPRMTSAKVNKNPWYNCLGLVGYMNETMRRKTGG